MCRPLSRPRDRPPGDEPWPICGGACFCPPSAPAGATAATRRRPALLRIPHHATHGVEMAARLLHCGGSPRELDRIGGARDVPHDALGLSSPASSRRNARVSAVVISRTGAPRRRSRYRLAMAVRAM